MQANHNGRAQAGHRAGRYGLARSARDAKSAILFIGDGMGPVQRQAARLSNGRHGLAMDALPVRGLVHTGCADPAVEATDSAAAATALATGVKTNNGMIGMSPSGEVLPTILELAKRAGKATGLVTTCQVTDATPAAFAAHVPDRRDQSEIARQFIEESAVDLILGGGADWWRPAGERRHFPSHPLDDPAAAGLSRHGDLIARARARGYRTALDPVELDAPAHSGTLGLFANQELFRQARAGEGDHYDPPVRLEALTAAAIRILSRHPGGFFLMVEEAAIDRMGHYNNRLAIKGVHELDRAVALGSAYAEETEETLVVVTADHECGGLGLDDAGAEPELPASLCWATTSHTAESVPLNAVGPGAAALAGEYENTHVFTALVAALGLG
jgi:alkaline phosphatase